MLRHFAFRMEVTLVACHGKEYLLRKEHRNSWSIHEKQFTVEVKIILPKTTFIVENQTDKVCEELSCFSCVF